jgi:hypothetical protein
MLHRFDIRARFITGYRMAAALIRPEGISNADNTIGLQRTDALPL